MPDLSSESDENKYVQRALLDRASIDREVEILIERDQLQQDESIKEWLKANWEWPDETEGWGIEWLFYCVVMNPDLLDILSRSEECDLRLKVAKQTFTDEHILLRLSNDEESLVRNQAEKSLASREEEKAKGTLDENLTRNRLNREKRIIEANKKRKINNQRYEKI